MESITSMLLDRKSVAFALKSFHAGVPRCEMFAAETTHDNADLLSVHGSWRK